MLLRFSAQKKRRRLASVELLQQQAVNQVSAWLNTAFLIAPQQEEPIDEHPNKNQHGLLKLLPAPSCRIEVARSVRFTSISSLDNLRKPIALSRVRKLSPVTEPDQCIDRSARFENLAGA
jgi:hypothetical protein